MRKRNILRLRFFWNAGKKRKRKSGLDVENEVEMVIQGMGGGMSEHTSCFLISPRDSSLHFPGADSKSPVSAIRSVTCAHAKSLCLFGCRVSSPSVRHLSPSVPCTLGLCDVSIIVSCVLIFCDVPVPFSVLCVHSTSLSLSDS